MKITAIVPAKKDSERCPKKNSIPFYNGFSLVELKIRQLKRINCLDEIILNTNDENLRTIAHKYNIRYVKRDEKFCQSSSSINDVYENIAQNSDNDIILYCNCTNPLIKDDTIIRCIKTYKTIDHEKYQSVNTCQKIKKFIWYKDNPLNYSYDHMPRSQDLPEYISPNFAINIISRDLMIKNKQIISRHPYFYIIDDIEGYDIDNKIDFQICQTLMRK